MKHVIEWFNSLKIQSKILLCFFAVILLAFSAVEITYYAESRNAMTELADQSTLVIIKQSQDIVETNIEEIEKLIALIQSDQLVIDFCETDGDEASFQKISLNNKFNNYQNIYGNVTAIAVVSDKGGFVSNELYETRNIRSRNQQWYRDAVRNPGRVILASNPYSRNLYYGNLSRLDNIMTVSRALQNDLGKVIGVVLVDIRLDVINEALKGSIPGTDGFVMMFDEYGKTVVAPVNKVAPRIETDWMTDASGILKKRIHGGYYEIVYVTSDKFGWKTVGVYSMEGILERVRAIRRRLTAILLITGGGATLVFSFMSKSLSKPLEKLTLIMKRAHEGELDIRFHVLYKDEVGIMAKAFNSLLDRIQELIQLVYNEQEKKRLAELTVLQEQIKPHFLYNTLDTIHWMAKKHDADEIASLVRCLANYYRLSLSKGSEVITLTDEISHIDNYMRIQQVRYRSIMTYRIISEIDTDRYFVQKLILQPLIENAIYHGIKEKGTLCRIDVGISIKGDSLRIIISDSGKGMTEERKEEILKMLRTGSNQTGRFGLFNVNERIRIAFGKDYGISLESRLEQGTMVEIRYPLITTQQQYYEMSRIYRGGH